MSLSNLRIFSKELFETSLPDSIKEKLTTAHITIIPETLEGETNLSVEAINCAKWVKLGHPELTIDTPSNVPVRVLKSHDVWLGVWLLAQDVQIHIVASLVADYIRDMISPREEKTRLVRLKIAQKEGENYRVLEYEGPLDGLEIALQHKSGE
jgi:phosphopantothenoylcysteine synthetase/decarboxylase